MYVFVCVCWGWRARWAFRVGEEVLDVQGGPRCGEKPGCYGAPGASTSKAPRAHPCPLHAGCCRDARRASRRWLRGAPT